MESAYLSSLPSALIAVDRALCIRFINPAAEMLLEVSARAAVGRALSFFPALYPWCDLCERVFLGGEAISLFEQTLRLPLNHRVVNLHLTPVLADAAAAPGEVLLTIEKADGLDRHAGSPWKQEMTRAAGVMAAMLAHEVKNPLSGIRGAAQLLRDEVTPEHQPLTELICRETDRIRDLLDQVEIFAAGAPEGRQEINIHEVLRYVIEVAKTGFARQVAFREYYDPSLPPVMAHRDLLVQLFLNLVKNAAEAVAGRADAAITITTAYRSGYKMRLSSFALPLGGGGQGGGVISTSESVDSFPPPQPSPTRGEGGISLPVAVAIEDNGPGIPQAVRAHLFEPFISSKEDGRGLGLAIVAKIASDIGAAVELDPEFDKGARFCVLLGVSKP